MMAIGLGMTKKKVYFLKFKKADWIDINGIAS
jgi:hypothetical protein